MEHDDEGPMVRAKRDAESDRDKEEESTKALEKSKRDAHAKEEQGAKVFEDLREKDAAILSYPFVTGS